MTVGCPILIDADNLIVRNIMLTALDDLKAGGVWTGGVYGTLRSLAALLRGMRDLPPAGIYAFFDGGTPAERLRCIPGYKAERAHRREVLSDEEKDAAYQQKGLCWEMFEHLGIVCARFEDREADDAVAAAARVFLAEGRQPVVVSGDRDLFQCVHSGAWVWYLNDRTWIRQNTILAAVGVSAARYLLFKTLIGDKSDSIRGCVGVKEKRALQILQEASEWLHTETKGQADFDDYAGHAQLELLRDFIVFKGEQKMAVGVWEHALVQDFDRLASEMEGIDLSNSFGPTDNLDPFLAQRPPIDKMGFLRFCQRLRMMSVLGTPDEHLRPFVEAVKVRDTPSKDTP
jgi:5'-3' exonuclease